jgi:hypothetical protein
MSELEALYSRMADQAMERKRMAASLPPVPKIANPVNRGKVWEARLRALPKRWFCLIELAHMFDTKPDVVRNAVHRNTHFMERRERQDRRTEWRRGK